MTASAANFGSVESIFRFTSRLVLTGATVRRDKNASIAEGKQVIVADKFFTEKGPAYFRADISTYYKMNKKILTKDT